MTGFARMKSMPKIVIPQRVALVATVLLLASTPAAGAPAPQEHGSGIVTQSPPPADQDREEVFVRRMGRWSYVLAPLLMVIVAILPIPAEFPAMLNGMLFGAVVGTAITWLGAIAGAWISFELARRFGRPLAVRFVRPATLARVDRVVDSAGWAGLLTLRLIPTVAFTAINWGAGFTAVPRWLFLWTTMVGILPGAIVFTTSGAGVAALLRAQPAAAAGLIAIVALVVWWTVVRYRRLDLKVRSER